MGDPNVTHDPPPPVRAPNCSLLSDWLPPTHPLGTQLQSSQSCSESDLPAHPYFPSRKRPQPSNFPPVVPTLAPSVSSSVLSSPARYGRTAKYVAKSVVKSVVPIQLVQHSGPPENQRGNGFL